jgi:hypothetical protein
MPDATRLLTTVPLDLPVDAAHVAEAIESLTNAALACSACADASLSGGTADELHACVRACTTTADVCTVAARVLARAGGYDVPVIRNLLEAAAKACATSGELCDHHAAVHKHCRVCEEACRRAEQGVQQLLVNLAAALA